jgi:hypothetical protein
MNGNFSVGGVTRDLAAMRDAGIGGVQIFEVGQGIPRGPVVYRSPEWRKLTRLAASEAERLGLEMTVHNCPGWSASGGPWITPELSMQQLVWTESFVAGGRRVTVSLPTPHSPLGFYRDAFVLAFPSLPGERQPMTELLRVVSKITTHK